MTPHIMKTHMIKMITLLNLHMTSITTMQIDNNLVISVLIEVVKEVIEVDHFPKVEKVAKVKVENPHAFLDTHLEKGEKDANLLERTNLVGQV